MSSILEQLAGAGGGAPADLPPSIPDPEAAAAPNSGPLAAAPPGETSPPSEVQTLKDMLGMADGYKSISSVTEQERAQMEKVTSVLQTLLASNEKMSDQMTGATPALRKAYG